jgi:hypothetical protein
MMGVMTLKRMLRREKYVVIHGQTARFRIVKYLVLLAIAWGLSEWQGWRVTGAVFLVLAALSIAMHFVLRWKTKAWTRSWGPYKKLDLPH